MPNCYTRVADLRAELLGDEAGTSDDVKLLRVIERVSRAFDHQIGRPFYSVLDTREYPESPREGGGRELWLPQDLVSVTTLKVDQDGDGVFETTLTANTDYVLWPYNRIAHKPARRIDLVSGGTLGVWPTNVGRVQLVGKFGYSDETEDVTTTTGALSDSTTSVPVASVSRVSAGDTLVLGSEQMDVESIASLTATVVRGVNGTTKASHLSGATVSRRRFPRDIEMATVMQAARFYREIQTGYSGAVGNADLAGFAFNTLYPAIRDLVAPYQRRRKQAI